MRRLREQDIDGEGNGFSWTVRSISKEGFRMILDFTLPSNISKELNKKHFIRMKVINANWISSSFTGKKLVIGAKIKKFEAPR
jgi:hypothetical protein